MKALIEEQQETSNLSAEGIINMHDTLTESLASLEKLGCKTTDWDPMIIQLMMKKLDFNSIESFENQLVNSKKMPSLECFTKFLKARHQTLDFINQNRKPK